MLILALVLHVFGNTLYAWLELAGEPVVLRWCRGLGFFLPMVAQILLFCGIFMYLPGENNGFRESLPGALFASLGWAAFSWGFSVYMERFADRTDIYGSVYAVALAMLWLYMCVSILFYGGALNCFLKAKGNII